VNPFWLLVELEEGAEAEFVGRDDGRGRGEGVKKCMRYNDMYMYMYIFIYIIYVGVVAVLLTPFPPPPPPFPPLQDAPERFAFRAAAAPDRPAAVTQGGRLRVCLFGDGPRSQMEGLAGEGAPVEESAQCELQPHHHSVPPHPTYPIIILYTPLSHHSVYHPPPSFGTPLAIHHHSARILPPTSFCTPLSL
jgi:hypothetical protein